MKRQKIVTFGELLLRFSKPGQLRLTQGDMFTSKYGGSEANVAVSLATQGEEVTYRPVPTIVLMPLRKNIPEPMNDWELRTCPSCGQECWFQAGDMKHIRAIFGKDLKHDRLILLCTECALKRKQEEGNDGIL